MATLTPGTRSVVLFVRSLSPTETPAPQHLERVRDLADAGRVSDPSVRVWGHEVALSTRTCRDGPETFVLDRIAEFRAWADDHDVSMEPFFDSREVSASLTGEEYAALRLPVTCLAEYEDDKLVHVAPYSTGDAICSVADRLRTLADVPVTDSDRRDDRAAPVDAGDGEPIHSREPERSIQRLGLH